MPKTRIWNLKKTTEIRHTIHWDFNHGMNGSFTQVCRIWCRDYCKQSLERFGLKQRWQELELPVVPLSERNSASRTGSLERSDFEERQERSGKQEEEDGILEYDSPSGNDDIPSLEREADNTM